MVFLWEYDGTAVKIHSCVTLYPGLVNSKLLGMQLNIPLKYGNNKDNTIQFEWTPQKWINKF